jgi:hypothetical protein
LDIDGDTSSDVCPFLSKVGPNKSSMRLAVRLSIASVCVRRAQSSKGERKPFPFDGLELVFMLGNALSFDGAQKQRKAAIKREDNGMMCAGKSQISAIKEKTNGMICTDNSQVSAIVYDRVGLGTMHS